MLGRALQYAPLTVSTAQGGTPTRTGPDPNIHTQPTCASWPHTLGYRAQAWFVANVAYLGSEGKNKPSSSPSWVLGRGSGQCHHREAQGEGKRENPSPAGFVIIGGVRGTRVCAVRDE